MIIIIMMMVMMMTVDVCVVMGKEIKKKMLSIVLGHARTFLLSTNIIICRYNSIIIFRCAFEAQYCECDSPPDVVMNDDDLI